MSSDVKRFFNTAGPLASVVGDGYRHRGEQVALAEKIAAALEGAVVLGDAPTGTGKRLAYSTPLVLEGEKVVISTATKVLQRLQEDREANRQAWCDFHRTLARSHHDLAARHAELVEELGGEAML
jgi:Rad3-related DNA helicase